MINIPRHFTKKLTCGAIIKGTMILTFAGIISKVLGFVYRILLTRQIGSEGLGLCQVAMPVLGIVFSLCCVGFQAAISRFTAKNTKDGTLWLVSSLCFCMPVAVILSTITFLKADLFATRILLQPDAAGCVRCLSLSFPFIVLHDCCCGYFYGYKKTAVPAVSQLLEQSSRIITLIGISILFQKNGITMTPEAALTANLLGEITAGVYSLLRVRHHKNKRNNNLIPAIKSLPVTLKFALPLSLNSLLLHLFQSAEAVLIPAQLMVSGCSSSESLKLYGILSGMAMPLIMLPSVLTNSLAVLLMPSVAEESKNTGTTIQNTIKVCLNLGIFSIFLYYFFLSHVGAYIFGEELLCQFTRLLSFLCPFIYMSTTITSILNGAGKTTYTCILNTLGIAIRLSSLVFLVPRYGINAYLYSLLISKISVCLLGYIKISHLFHIKMDAGSYIIKPLLCSSLATGISLFSTYLFKTMSASIGLNVYDSPICETIVRMAAACLAVVIYFIQWYIFSRSMGAKTGKGASL